MRSMAFILWLAFIGIFAIPTKGQETAPCRNETNYLKQQDMQKTISLRKAFSLLQKAHHIHIVYDEALIKGKTLPSKLQVSDNLSDDLWRILRKYSLTFEVVGENTIVIMPRHQTKKGVVKGKITNEHGEGIAGAQVIIEGTTFGAAADLGGEYRIVNLPPGTYTLRTKVIGYHPQKALIQVRANKIVHKDFSLAPDVIQMDEVVVTATLNPSTRRESSIAITTKTLDQINAISPRSTADLLRVIPGFYVESSGGEVGGNLFVRGLPADGSYYYVALMEDGMPVYDAPALSFVNADIFVRVDENIERMEAVRGGNSALFGINAPGGVINFINKSGGNQLSATLKTTVGTGGLARYDFNFNGPLGNLWRFNTGGFFRYDNGIRNPGFLASKGGQIKGNLTCFFKNGYVKFYGKYLNDSNIFYLQLPFKSGRELKFVDGFPRNGTLTTFEGNGVQVPTPGAGTFTIPLGDGQKQVGGSVTAKFNFEFPNGWNLQNTIRYMSINHAWNALLPFNLVDAGDWAQNYVNRTPGGAGYNIVFTNHFSAGGGKAAFNTANGLLCEGGLWRVVKPLSNISNQLMVKKNVLLNTVKHRFTIGTYQGYYTAVDHWYWQDILTDVRNAPRFVDVQIKDSTGKVIRSVTENGFRRYGSMYMNARGFVTTASLFLGDNIDVTDKFHVDVGARIERKWLHQKTENSQLYDLGGPSDADDSVMWGDGTFKRADIKYDDWASSLGLNYLINNNLSIYVRGSRGYKMPTLDVFRGADSSFKPKPEELIQAESGLKLGAPTFGINATTYFMQLENFPSQDARVVNGQTEWVIDYVGKSQTYGLEVESVTVPLENLTIRSIVTLQNHMYKKFISGEKDFSGNWVQRIPKIIYEITASYSAGGFDFRTDYYHVGKRFSNNANTIELPCFDVTNFSTSYSIKMDKTQRLVFSLNLFNAFDGNGLTEGNPRLDNSGPNKGTYYLARPILPKRLKASLTYEF